MAKKKYYIYNASTGQLLNVAQYSEPLPDGWELISKERAAEIEAAQRKEGGK